MKRAEIIIMLSGAVALLGACAYMVLAILAYETAKAEEVTEPEPPRVHRPTKCQPYYQDGTDRWIECMGVGKR